MHMNQLQELEPSKEQVIPLPSIWLFHGNRNCKAQLIQYQKQNFIHTYS